MRAFWFLLGLGSLALGLVGVILPLVPTVPLILLAAFSFARSSDRLHDWIMDHRLFGPMTRDWRENGAVSKRGKIAATVSIVAVFLISVVLGIKPLVLIIQAIVLSGVLIFIWSRPTG